MSKKSVHRQRSHFIFHLFLLLIIVAQSFSFSLMGKTTDGKIAFENEGPVLLEGAIEITDEGIKTQIKGIVDEIHARDDSFLDGVESILVSKEDIDFLSDETVCDGHLLGAFSDDKILIKESGKETNRRTLYHEVGHNVWGSIEEAEKIIWNSLFLSSENFITPYASTSAEEDFAESFACIMTDQDGCVSLDEGKKTFLEGIAN